MKIKHFFTLLLLFLICSKGAFAETKSLVGVVNFMTCIQESKYGQNEQKQLENIKKQWTSLIEETDAELKKIQANLEDQDYLDGLSPDGEKKLKEKQQTLHQDIAKYQNQLYQILNQAQYFFVQKMSNSIAKASEAIAKKKKLDIVLNKEACFYNDPNKDITSLVIAEMDKSFEKEAQKNKENAKTEEPQKNEVTEPKKEVK